MNVTTKMGRVPGEHDQMNQQRRNHKDSETEAARIDPTRVYTRYFAHMF